MSHQPAHDADEIALPLWAEHVTVGRRLVAGDRVAVRRITRHEEHAIDETLRHERVEVERVPIGREVQAVPEVRDDGELMVVPVVEEQLVVRRRLVLTEEIRLRRVRSERRHTDTVTIRRQVAEISRIPPAADTPGPAPLPDNTEEPTA